MGRLIIEETSVYELDEECMWEKELERRQKKREPDDPEDKSQIEKTSFPCKKG